MAQSAKQKRARAIQEAVRNGASRSVISQTLSESPVSMIEASPMGRAFDRANNDKALTKILSELKAGGVKLKRAEAHAIAHGHAVSEKKTAALREGLVSAGYTLDTLG